MHNTDMISPAVFIGSADELNMRSSKIGDIVMESNSLYIKTETDWMTIATAPFPSYYEHTHPANCVNCGAPLCSFICEYCGTEY